MCASIPSRWQSRRLGGPASQLRIALERGGAPLDTRRKEMLATLGRKVENRNRDSHDWSPYRDSGLEIDR
ncbi:hypothetical protein [Burkholderia sp. GS2Y]|uniref:Uncharacterized protein n=1 Tax=Burkholderia theae TaxID=3143496 RepID=A0ABU9WJE8_9BURK